MNNLEETIKDLKKQTAYFRLIAIAIFSLIIISSIFYHLVEKWKWLDCVYFTVVTMATVGYGDYTPTTNTAKIYTMALIVVGIGLFGVFINQLVKRQGLRRAIKQQNKQNK